jgi:hypothetical protein
MLFLNVTISGPHHLDANAQIGRPGASSSVVPITVAFLTFFTYSIQLPIKFSTGPKFSFILVEKQKAVDVLTCTFLYAPLLYWR